MADLIEQEEPSGTAELRRVMELFGGNQVFANPIETPLDVHEMLVHGLPVEAMCHLVENGVIRLDPSSFTNVLGMSQRTYQRCKLSPTKPLSLEQSGRTWKFAEILAKATEVFGSQADAEEWLERPAMGLNQHRPIDLLATPAGVELVEDFLVRIEGGVYT